MAYDGSGESLRSPVAGETATAADLITCCRERLAKFKVPVEVEFLDELPKSEGAKA